MKHILIFLIMCSLGWGQMTGREIMEKTDALPEPNDAVSTVKVAYKKQERKNPQTDAGDQTFSGLLQRRRIKIQIAHSLSQASGSERNQLTYVGLPWRKRR